MNSERKNILSKFSIKEKKALFITIISLTLIIATIFGKTYAIEGEAYTRKEMQDKVVATALSYFYNKEYTDYEQYGMDAWQSKPYYLTTYFWRNPNTSPEMVSRSNRINLDCSSFALATYLYSIGYDMSEYYKIYTTSYLQNNQIKYVKDSVSNFQEAYIKYGKGWNQGEFSQVLEYELADQKPETGIEYKNDSDENITPAVYYYRVKDIDSNKNYIETKEEQEQIKENIINILQPGDTLFYRRINKETGEKTGHVLIYVADAISKGEHGFIHSTGTDFSMKTNPITIGEDTHAVRYDTWEDRIASNIFIDSETVSSYSFGILRPINTYCDGESDICLVDKEHVKSNEYNENLFFNLNNTNTRVELSGLRIEQFQRDNFNSKTLNKYNSMNNGNEVTYSIYLSNKTKFGYCSHGYYITEEKCTNAGYQWKNTTRDTQNYNNLIITAKIPTGTNYISCYAEIGTCNYKYDTITWQIPQIKPAYGYIFRYTVKVNTDENVINEGMTITTETGNNLKLSKIKTQIKPTINYPKGKTKIKEEISKFEQQVNNGKITYNYVSEGSYKKDLDSIQNVNMNQFDFVKSIYYNFLGIDLKELTEENIPNALFNNHMATGYNVYLKKTDEEINNLTNDEYKNINKMLVPGMYGGRLLKGNDNLDRARFLNTNSLEFGDIIVTFDFDNNLTNVYLFYGFDQSGNSVFVEYNKNSNNEYKVLYYDNSAANGKSGWRVFKEIFAQDLFAVLRPSTLGTTVEYNYNGGIEDINLYVAYDVYRNLNVPTKESYVTTFNYNKTVSSSYPTSLVSANEFEGWYSDANLTNKVTNTTKLASTSSHTLNAKWNTSAVTLPSPTITGYKIEGWYKNSGLTTKAGNAGASYTPTSTNTLYANWNPITYQVKYDANGGTGTMQNSEHTYDVSKELTKNAFTRTGYTFAGWSKTQTGETQYIDEETVRNLTEENNGIVNLYAVWKPVTYKIKYNLDGGSVVNPETYTIETPNFKLNNPSKEGYKFIGWTTSTDGDKKLEVEIVRGTTGDKEYTANYEIAKYSVVYKSDENGSITGKAVEEIQYQSNPTGTTQEAKEGYKDLKWAVDKDVELKDGTIINKGKSITEEQIKNIVIKEDITITIYHYQIKYNVSYESSENGEVDRTSEEVAQNANPLGVKISPNKGYKLSHFIADKDVELKDGTVIKTGEEITEEQLLEIVIKEDIKLKAMYELAKYTVRYESNENGSIKGVTSEEISYQNSPLGTIVIPNKNYEILNWIANKDVVLKNGKEIKAGEEITEEELKEIKVESDLVLTVKYIKTVHTVYYKSDSTINITGILKEEVRNLNSPQGTKVEAQDVNSYIIWIANKDVELKDGTIIKAGEEITAKELSKILVKEDLILTAYAKNNVKIEVPNTGSVQSIVVIGLGITLVVGGIYLVHKRKKEIN